MEFVDVHTHILPEFDDGARDFNEAVMMLEEAVEAGVRKILLTPHVALEGNPLDAAARMSTLFDGLLARAAQKTPGLELYLGAELMMHPDLPACILKEQRLTVNGAGSHVLLEMPMSEIPFYARAVCFGLLTKGIKLIWAHPERCADVVRDYKLVQAYADDGVLLQIDAGSLIGLNGRKIRQTAETLVKKNLAHIVASDAHRSGEIRKTLPDAFVQTSRLVGEQRAGALFFSTPLAALKP